MDYIVLKERLQTKISKVSIEKHYKNKVVDNCEHDYKKYKQTITERSSKNSFNKSAYFVVLLCDKCKDKKIIDYKVI